MPFVTFCIALFLLFAGPSAHAGNNVWTRIGPSGAAVSALQFDPADPSVVVALTAEVVISRDGGATWSTAYRDGSTIHGSLLAFVRSRIYVVTDDNRLYASSDGGVTWTVHDVPWPVLALQADAEHPDNVYLRVQLPAPASAFLGSGIAKSTDGGATWTLLPTIVPNSGVYEIVADPVRANILYAGAAVNESPFPSAFYRSDDGGVTWHVLNAALPSGAFAYLSIDASHPDTLYLTRIADERRTVYLARSVDGGATWQVSATDMPRGPNDAYYVVPDRVRYGTLFLGFFNGYAVYRSVDFGVSWADTTTGVRPLTNATRVVPHPTQAGRVFVLTDSGLYRSDDDGATLTEITQGLSSRQIDRLEIDAPRLIAKSWSPGPWFESLDSGAHWSIVPAPDAPIAGLGHTITPTIGARPWSTRRYALVGNPSSGRANGNPATATLFRTDDDGRTWTHSTLSGLEIPDFLYAVTDGDPPRMFGFFYTFTCGAHGCNPTGLVITRSEDGGASWHALASNGSANLHSIAVSSGNPDLVVLSLQTGIARSTDGGATFTTVPFTESIAGTLWADPHDGQTFFAASAYSSTLPPRFYRSADGGSTWAVLPLAPQPTLATGGVVDVHFSRDRPGRIDIVAAQGLIERSEDSGASWKGLSPGPGDGNGAFGFARTDPSTVYFVSGSRGIAAYTIARDTPVDVVEFRNTILDHYFMTAAAEEAAGIDRGAAGPGWVRTGHAFKAWLTDIGAPAGVRPVCRFYGTPGLGPNSHFYTIDAAECAAVQHDAGWTLEATDVFYAYPPNGDACADGKQPIRRAYNDRFAFNDSNHRYATDAAAYAEVVARGWLPEGVVLCAEP